MHLFPGQEAFSNRYNTEKGQCVWAVLPADLYTPVSVMLRLKDEPYCGLFESVEGGKSRARYSFIVLQPDLIWECRNEEAVLKQVADGYITPISRSGKIFPSLREFLKQSTFPLPNELPPMASGIFGFLGYDMVRFMEDIPHTLPDTLGIPDAVFIRPQLVIVFDTVTDVMFLVSPVFYDKNKHADIQWEAAKKRIEMLVAVLGNTVKEEKSIVRSINVEKGEDITVKNHVQKSAYGKIVEKAKEYIYAGDIFQVVLSQRFSTPFTLPPFFLYRKLRRINPSPFSFFFRFQDYALIGASPEILVRLRNGKVTIRPIAGTRKRGKNQEEDHLLAKDLLADTKELAEHLMLLDLGRNDVGRVVKGGTVKVTEYMNIEYYSHVMHVVSNVEGELAEGKDAIDALVAGFPAGTVSGAPKIRAMEIIDELEIEKRSFYAGCVGYISSSGDMDTCITLRTGLVKDDMLYVQAGGGIVADSTPESEYQECCNKAKAVLFAAAEALKESIKP